MISKQAKLYLIIGLIVLFLLSAVYFVLAGAEQKPDENKLPSDFVDEKNVSENDKVRVELIVDDVFSDINGVSYSSSKTGKLADLLALSDTLFVFACNVWLRKYFNENKETLKQALIDEWSFNRPEGWLIVRDNVVERMTRLKVN